MPDMQSPDGEVLSIPSEGVHALRALGWVERNAEPVTAAPEGGAVVEVDAPAAPKETANRGEWAAYAESLGIESGDLTKAQLREAVNDL